MSENNNTFGSQNPDFEKALKPNQPDCSICGKLCFMSGMSIPMVARTESGEIADIHTNKEESMSIITPLCAYHMVIAGEGYIAFDGEKIVYYDDLKQLESLSSDFIKQTINNIKARRDVPMPVRKYNIKLGNTILEARKFQDEMEKLV